MLLSRPPFNTYEQLSQLGSTLKKLPPEWKYEVKTLTQDLAFDVRKATPAGLKNLALGRIWERLPGLRLRCGLQLHAVTARILRTGRRIFTLAPAIQE